jgi:hypothetical protein
MNVLKIIGITVFFFLSKADAIDTKILHNNKESYSRKLTSKDIFNGNQWLAEREEIPVLEENIITTLKEALEIEQTHKDYCEIRFIKNLKIISERNGLIKNFKDLDGLIAFMRKIHIIDDIFFNILKKSISLSLEIDVKSQTPYRLKNNQSSDFPDTDLKNIYEKIQQSFNDESECSIDAYEHFENELALRNKKSPDKKILQMNIFALTKGFIDLNTFQKLNTIKNSGFRNMPIRLKKYIQIISDVKDKLSLKPETKTSHSFVMKHESRRNQITHRDHLYQNYNSTQILILSQIVEKTSRRINANSASLNWNFTDQEEEEIEVYVFSPMEQYRAAIKMLKRDMAEIMRSEAFQNQNVEYEHLITAAFETGFIKSEEIDYVLKFEDFWNPKNSRWKAYINMAISLTGSATFYLPPPWNTVGALGLLLSQARNLNRGKKPIPEDNWNVII